MSGFDGWFARYPRKVGEPQARSAWRHTRLQASEAELHAALDAWLAFWVASRTEVRFVPYPQTWLVREDWRCPPIGSQVHVGGFAEPQRPSLVPWIPVWPVPAAREVVVEALGQARFALRGTL